MLSINPINFRQLSLPQREIPHLSAITGISPSTPPHPLAPIRNLLSELWLFLQCFPEFQFPSIPQKWFALPSYHSSLTPNPAKLCSIIFKLKLKFLDFLFVSVIKVLLGTQSSIYLSCRDSFRGLMCCFRCTSCDWQWITWSERQIFLLYVETFPTGSSAISNKYCWRQKKQTNKQTKNNPKTPKLKF